MWRYRIPGSKRDSGGVVVIDETGLFTAVTDFGNYAHWWPGQHSGYSDFRLFIHNLSRKCAEYPDYLLEKVRRKRTEIDFKALRKKLTLHIFEMHKKHLSHKKKGCKNTRCSHGEWSPRNIHCHYERCDLEWRNKMLKFVKEMSDKSELDELYHTYAIPDLDWSEGLVHYEWDCQALFFAREIMPRLHAQLDAELKAEGLL